MHWAAQLVAAFQLRALSGLAPSPLDGPRVALFNPQHPVPLMLWGEAAQRCGGAAAPQDLAARGLRMLIVCQRAALPDLGALEAAGIACFAADAGAHELLFQIRRWLRWRAAPQELMHGVLMDIYGLGVLLTGGSGAGKSELALDLVSRGHRLVADDAVEVCRLGDVLLGRCPSLLQDLAEVRGLGVLNVRRLYGEAAIRMEQRLDLVLHLDNRPEQPGAAPRDEAADRLSGQRATRDILGVGVPEIFLRAKLGHNQRALVEAACRDHWLRLSGYRSDEEFIVRQEAAIKSQTPECNS